ncbi:MAG: peptide chain release factor 2 [Dehalococcoidia bacterium]|nr:peptide chain release factor 2 [Dehalococcoidia bacterium]
MHQLLSQARDLLLRISDTLVRLDLSVAEERLTELETQSSEASFWDDSDMARVVMQEISVLRERVETWRGLEGRARDQVELLELAIAEDDDSFAEQASGELLGLEGELERLEFELQLSGEYDQRDAILAIHAGAGGTESQDWAEMLLRMYLRWSEAHGYSTEVLDTTEGEEAGIKSTTVEVRGPLAFGYLASERGVHRLVRLSPFDAAHARHTSFAKVEVMPEVTSNNEIEISPDEIRVDVFRASGHGGQNVQKNSTAIRITHIPTGIVVTCQNERSQHRNRTSAMKVLEARLLERELLAQEEERARLKGKHIDMGWGNQIRSYVLHPYKLVKDHRTEFETSNTAAVLDGDLDDLMASYLRARVGEEA